MGRQMYHYRDSGLDNVYLVNGYRKVKTAEGNGVSISDIDGLHRAIGLHLATQRRPLSGRELRFLRIELDMSQKLLGQVLDKTDQAVAKWEKGDEHPRADEMVLRLLYLETIGEDSKLRPLIEDLNKLDRHIQENQLRFQIDTALQPVFFVKMRNGWRYLLANLLGQRGSCRSGLRDVLRSGQTDRFTEPD
jgi:putative transcriptional regulator